MVRLLIATAVLAWRLRVPPITIVTTMAVRKIRRRTAESMAMYAIPAAMHLYRVPVAAASIPAIPDTAIAMEK